MNIKQMIGRFGAIALLATALCAQAQEPKTANTNEVKAVAAAKATDEEAKKKEQINALLKEIKSEPAKAETKKAETKTSESKKTIRVVGLEDDKDNAVVEAPAALKTKPTISVDDIQKAAAPVAVVPAAASAAAPAEAPAKKPAAAAAFSADAFKDDETKANTANVKDLVLEGMVIPPSAAQVKTLEEAIRNIILQAGKQVGTVSSNGIDKLTGPYEQLGDGKGYEIEWRKALRLLLAPVDYNFTEDAELVLFGRSAEVDVKHKQLAQERLTSNRTTILFTTNEAEGGMELRNAIRDVSVKANVTITTDYMEPGDLFVPVKTSASSEKMTADQVAKAKEKSVAQQSSVKRTTFDTNGQQIEWRIVLREILNPHDYDFIEVGGVVRIAKRAKLAQWEKEAIAAKPLAAKVIRLFHADPEEVVKRVMTIKGILVHPNASLQATRKKDDSTDTVKNLNARIQTSSGQQSGMSDTTSQVFDKLVRPRTVPAIVAYDVEENIPNIEAKIKLFDIKEKQILIEAILFQLDMNNGNGDQDGIKWSGFENFVPLYGAAGTIASATQSAIDNLEFAEALAEGASATRTLTSDGFKLTGSKELYMKTGRFDFKSTIQLIREQENSKILASPMLVVGDHSQAAIQVSDVDPIPQVDASTVSGGSGTFNQNMNIQWNMLRSGVLMWVSPEITESGTSVRLTVHPQVVTKGNKVSLKELGGTFAEYPLYNYELKQHEMDTRATVPSGATLMFGGLIDNEEAEVETKVRWLGDIPVLGWFFRSKTKTVVQKNLVIIIRPTILEDTDQTGFETNALKEVKDYSANTGRDLRKTPYGPHSYKEVKENVKKLVHDRVVKPFEDEPVTDEKIPADESAEPAKSEPSASPKPVDAESLPRQDGQPKAEPSASPKPAEPAKSADRKAKKRRLFLWSKS